MNIVSVTTFGVGGILLYSAVTDRNPVQVVTAALAGKVAPKNNSTDWYAALTPQQQAQKDKESAARPPGQTLNGPVDPNSSGTYTGNGGHDAGSISYVTPYPYPST